MFLAEDQLAYAARDVAHLHELASTVWGEIERARLDVVADLEFSLVPVIVEMETAGIAVDKAKLREIETKARSSAAGFASLLRNELHLPALNPGSPRQLLKALKSQGIKVADTNEETLKAADDGEIIPLILDYRGAEKLAQQAASLLECVKQDGRIHGRFDPTGTKAICVTLAAFEMDSAPSTLAPATDAPEGCLRANAAYAHSPRRSMVSTSSIVCWFTA